MLDIIKKVTEYDRARLIVTLDMILSIASLVERLLISKDENLTEEDKLKKIDEIDVKYAQQKALSRK